MKLVILWKHQFFHWKTEIEHNCHTGSCRSMEESRWSIEIFTYHNFQRISLVCQRRTMIQTRFELCSLKYLEQMFNETVACLNVSHCLLSVCLCQWIDSLNTWVRAFSFCLLFENETCFLLWISWSSSPFDQSLLRNRSSNSLNRLRHQLPGGLQFTIVQSQTIGDLGTADSSMCETINYVNDCVLLIEIIHQSSHSCLRLKDTTISSNKSYCPRARFRFH